MAIATTKPGNQLSPVRPISDTLPAGASRSYTGLAKGFIIQSVIGADGTTPIQIMVGFNKQPPVLIYVRDAFTSDTEFKTVEIYNTSATIWNIKATLFDGTYIPSSSSTTQSITNVSAGIFTPLASSPATLKSVPTVGLVPTTIIEYVDSTTLALTSYQLRSDVSGAPAAGKVVPNDYNASTNPFSWYAVL